MPHINKQVKYIPLTKYPHMRPADIEIWERFLTRFPHRFLNVIYDCAVGERVVTDAPVEEKTKINYADLCQWRIDVVATDGLAIYIIEVKPFANAKAVGQVDCYRDCFIDEGKPALPVKAIIITDRLHPNIVNTAAKNDVEIWVV